MFVYIYIYIIYVILRAADSVSAYDPWNGVSFELLFSLAIVSWRTKCTLFGRTLVSSVSNRL